jgi:hypothetical protein
MELNQLIEHHAALRNDWQLQLEQLQSSQIIRQKITGEDVTADTIQFMRGQIARLDALDRLLARMLAPVSRSVGTGARASMKGSGGNPMYWLITIICAVVIVGALTLVAGVDLLS